MIDDDIELENSEELDQLEYTEETDAHLQISKSQQNPIIRRWYSNKS